MVTARCSRASPPSKTTSTDMPARRRPAAIVVASLAWSSTTSTLIDHPSYRLDIGVVVACRGLPFQLDRRDVATALLRCGRATSALVQRVHRHVTPTDRDPR